MIEREEAKPTLPDQRGSHVAQRAMKELPAGESTQRHDQAGPQQAQLRF
jgi:hypothetical protein